MPIYEYECEKCGYVFEQRKGFGDATLEDNCLLGCGGLAKRKEVNKIAGIIFKGEGFYKTDISNNNRKKYSPDKSSKEEAIRPEDIKIGGTGHKDYPEKVIDHV